MDWQIIKPRFIDASKKRLGKLPAGNIAIAVARNLSSPLLRERSVCMEAFLPLFR